MSSDEVARTQALVEQIEPLMAGKGPNVQGAVLLDLLATWLAGHHPDLRRAVLSEFLQALIKLTAVNEKIIFGDAGFPTEGLN